MIQYVRNPQLDMQAVLNLYNSVGWSSYTNRADMLERAIKGSRDILAAFEGDKLVGLIRTVGDGASILFIQDLLVLPSYQRQGIGATLLNRIVSQYKGIHQMHLLTGREPETMSFYQAAGFTAVEEVDCIAYTYLQQE